MPIYEYTCHTCGEDFEALQKFSDAPLTRCQCGKEGKVERKLSLSAFHLQGGGWYKDLYGAGKNGNGAADSGGNGKPAEGAAKDKSEPKAAKSDSPDKSKSSGKTGGDAGGKSSGTGGSSSPASP